MMARYIKLYEQILDWEWFNDTVTFKVFVYLLLKANYCDSRFQGIEVKRGQLVTSTTKLATSNNISFQQARTALSHLQSTGEITSQAYHDFRVITVVKYEDFQGSTSQATSHQQAINKPTNKQSTSQATTSIELIEDIEHIYKENSPTESKRKTQDDSWFDQFWEAYPKKVSKPEAKKAWKKLKPDAELMEKIMDGLAAWKTSDQWNRDGGQYIPYPASWLRGCRWEDEVNGPSAKTTASQFTGYNQRPAAKTVIAQQYEQRDYKDIQEQHMQRQQEYILRRLAEEGDV